MAKQISLSTVKAQLSSFIAKTGSAANAMTTINNSYIEGTQNEWNTPFAASFIDGLVGTFNDYIQQFNSKYQEGVDEFVSGVNTLAESEDADPVPAQTVQQITELSKSWVGQPEDFNIPDDFGSFTESNLTANIENFTSILDEMQTCIDTAVDSGLSGEFCTGLKQALASLKNSATSVAQQYSKEYAAQAVEEDTSIQSIKSAT